MIGHDGEEPTVVTVTTIDELEGARLRGCRIIDVREPHEYRAGHVPGAQLMPEPQVPLHLAGLRQRTPMYLICESGNRSRRVAEYLRGHGYDARTVQGGTSAWRLAGRPVSTIDQ